MHNTILQRVKKFLIAKIVNLEKIKQEKYQPPPPPPFKRTCPCTILPPPFLIFQIPPSGGGKRNFRLQHMRCVITCACLCTCLKHWRRTKKSMPCLIKKASRCAADHTPKTAKFFIFSFLSNTKILGENHVYLFVILLVQL